MSDKKYEEWLKLMKDTPKEEILKYHYKLLFKVDKQKEAIDKIKEYTNNIRNLYWVEDDTPRYVSEDINKILEEIE